MSEHDNERNLPQIRRPESDLGRPDSRLLSRGLTLYNDSRLTRLEIFRLIPTASSIFICSVGWDSSYHGDEGWEYSRTIQLFEFGWDGRFTRRHSFRLHSLTSAGINRIAKRPSESVKLEYMGEWFYFREVFRIDESRSTIVVNYLFEVSTDELTAVWSSDAFLDDYKLPGQMQVPVINDLPLQWVSQSAFGTLRAVRPSDWNGEWIRSYLTNHIVNSALVHDFAQKFSARYGVINDSTRFMDHQVDCGVHAYPIELALDTTIHHDGTFLYDFTYRAQQITDEESVWIHLSPYGREMVHIFLDQRAGRAERYVLPDPNDLISSGTLRLIDYHGNEYHPPAPLVPFSGTFPDTFPAYCYHLGAVSNGRLLVHLETRLDHIGGALQRPVLILECAEGQITAVRTMRNYGEDWWQSNKDSTTFWKSLADGTRLSGTVPDHFSGGSFHNTRVQGDKLVSTASAWFDYEEYDPSYYIDIVVVTLLDGNGTSGFIPRVPQELAPRPFPRSVE